MDRLILFAHQLSRYGAWFGGTLIICAAVVITVDVVIRKVFVTTLGGADELSTFALAIGSAWAFSFTMLERAHVRIESVYVLLPARAGAVLDLIAHLAFTAIIMVIAWHAYLVFEDSFNLNARTLSPLGTPVAIPQFLWAAGFAYFVLVALLLALRSVMALFTGDLDTVRRFIGPRSVKVEIEEELEQVKELREGEVKE